MHGLQSGIVLQSHAFGAIISLLDSNCGRIEAVFSQRKKISPGVMISYRLQKKGERFFVDSHQLIHSPLLLAQSDILFLHHILELVIVLVPQGIYEPELFLLLKNLYVDHILNSVQKKIMISNLLAIVGILVEPIPESCKTFWKIPIDMINLGSLHLLYEQHLDGWLKRCFSQHPLLYDLKTVRLLKAENFFEGK